MKNHVNQCIYATFMDILYQNSIPLKVMDLFSQFFPTSSLYITSDGIDHLPKAKLAKKITNNIEPAFIPTKVDPKHIRMLQLRGSINTNQRYKKNTIDPSAKYQLGTVIESGLSREKKNKKRPTTLLDSLMRDDRAKAKLKRRYNQIQKVKNKKFRS